MTTVLLDSSFLYALYTKTDANHQRAIDLVRETRVAAVIPESILDELKYLLHGMATVYAVMAFLEAILKITTRIEPTTIGDTRRALAIQEEATNGDAPDFVDCSIAAVAERLEVCTIYTFEPGDFARLEIDSCDGFELLPRASC